MDMIVLPDLSGEDIPDFKICYDEPVPEKEKEAEKGVSGSGIHTNEATTVEQYFAYYSKLYNQQNMLQDDIRTGIYRKAILENEVLFKDKIVMDVGAGTSILSIFAA